MSANTPSSADGQALGSASLEWSDLFLADSGTITFGNDQDTILTHTDGTGLTLNSTNKLCFNDASQFIQGASATVLDIAATDEIELTATLIDVVGNFTNSGTIVSAGVITAPSLVLGSTAVTSTPAELNLIDGGATVGTTAVADGDGILHNDGGAMKVTSAATFKTYFQEGISTAFDDLTTGDAAVTIDTTSGNITVDSNAGLVSIDGHTGVTLASSNSGDITLDSVADINLDAGGADIVLKDGGTQFGKITNASTHITIYDGTTLNTTMAGANITFAGTVGSGAITSTGIVTGTAFTAGSAVLAEAELELLDGLTAGTAIASKVVTTDASIDTTGQRNLTITGELDAATLDISGAIDVAGASVLHGALTQSGAVFTQDGGAVFNEGSADVDFRVESNGHANRFFVNGGDDTVLFGTQTSQSLGDTFAVQIMGATQAEAGLAITRNSANNGYANLVLGKSRHATPGSFTIVADNDRIGRINFLADDGNDLATSGAHITAQIDGTPGANDMPTELILATTADGANDPTDRLTIKPDGDVQVNSGDIVFTTAGKGICLGVTSNTAANTLDDYEEGTWTPVVAGTSSAGTYTYAYNDGSYTKVGNLVTLWCNIGNISTGSEGSGNLSVTGMPFATASGIGYYQACVLSQWDTAGGPMTYTGASSSTIYFEYYPDSSGAGANVDITDKNSNGADCRFQFCYRA